jgi:hypothetical protein
LRGIATDTATAWRDAFKALVPIYEPFMTSAVTFGTAEGQSIAVHRRASSSFAATTARSLRHQRDPVDRAGLLASFKKALILPGTIRARG